MAVSTGSSENAGRSGGAEVARAATRRGAAARRPRRSRHEVAALLRAHLSAAAQVQRHLTPHCPVCHQLQRLALESETDAPRPSRPGERRTAR